MNLEFVDESSEDSNDSSDDVLDAGTDHRVPRWIVGVGVATVAATALVVVVRGSGPEHHPVAAQSSSPSAPATSSSVPLSYADQTLLSIYRLARDTTQAHDIIRSGSDATLCKSVKIGTAPQRRAASEIVHQLPGYTVIDAARTIDQGAGLCDLQVRAGKGGTVAVLMVVSPTESVPAGQAAHVESHSTSIGATAIVYTQRTTKDGWTIIIGTSGPKAEQPPASARSRIVQSPSVRW